MKVLELFCGTKSIGNAFERKGHEVYTVDWDAGFCPTLCADIGALTAEDVVRLCNGVPDVIWASPDCTTFSIAAISKHRTKAEDGTLLPKSEYAKRCDEIDSNVIKLIQELTPNYWFIENPRGGMRKSVFMKPLNEFRYTVTYCQYGDTRMKPTDIWTNHPSPKFKPACHNGDPCHERAPRGARTGTQGLKTAKDRSVIPAELANHIVEICENDPSRSD